MIAFPALEQIASDRKPRRFDPARFAIGRIHVLDFRPHDSEDLQVL